MSKRTFEAEYDVDGLRVGLGVQVLIWEEDGMFYAMAPALDITGYGKTEREAERSFEVMTEEFMLYTHRKKTIFKALENLGWKVNAKKKRVAAPTLEEQKEDNSELAELLDRPGVKTKQHELQLAL